MASDRERAFILECLRRKMYTFDLADVSLVVLAERRGRERKTMAWDEALHVGCV